MALEVKRPDQLTTTITPTTATTVPVSNGSALGKTTVGDIQDILPAQGVTLSGQQDPGSAIDLAVSASTWTQIGFGSTSLNTNTFWSSQQFTPGQAWYQVYGALRTTDLAGTGAEVRVRIRDVTAGTTLATWHFPTTTHTFFHPDCAPKLIAPVAFNDIQIQVWCDEACTFPISGSHDTWFNFLRIGKV